MLRVLRSWLWANRKDLGFVVLFWFILSTAYLIKEWPSVSALELGDNDNYMRYVQFTSWIELGNWYLEPMPNFNPQDGVIMHWSRLPDIPLAVTSLLLMQFMAADIAYPLAMSLVPLLYMLILMVLSFAYCEHYLGKEQRFIATLYILLSPIITKFLPGSIDHHNVQLLFVVAFLLFSPITKEHFQQGWRAYAQGLMLALSLWTGLENFILWVLYLACYTLHAIYFDSSRTSHLKRLCFSVFGLGLILMVVNRPLVEFFTPQYDAISLPFVLCFLGGGILLAFYEKWVLRKDSATQRVFLTGIIAFPVFGSIVFAYPELIKGAYADYPPLLQQYWLSNVSEARSMWAWMQKHGFFSVENYFLYFIPALSYPFIRAKSTSLNLLYSLLVLNLVIALFWQIRAISLCFILSAPLQAYVLYQWLSLLRNELVSALILIVATPLVSVVILDHVFPNTTEGNKIKVSSKPLNYIFYEHDIYSKKILTGIETGSKIIAKSNNKIIAAPYHRNINGNSLMISTFLQTDMGKSKNRVMNNKVDYILINQDAQLNIILNSASNTSLIKRLKDGNPPPWLKLISHEGSDYILYKVSK